MRRDLLRRPIDRAIGAWLLPAALLSLVVLLAAGCATHAPTATGDGRLLLYERAFASGELEDVTVWPDGRVLMHHGEHLERFTIDAESIALLTAALEATIPTGGSDTDPTRTLTLADGRRVESIEPVTDSIVPLLDRLMETHSIEVDPQSPVPHEHGAADDHEDGKGLAEGDEHDDAQGTPTPSIVG